MARIPLILAALAVIAAAGAALIPHGSQAAARAPQDTIQRTFVSTGGSDANPCTRAQPCRGFTAAIGLTTAGGEVIALDSGGYGAFLVPKSLTIAGAPGVHAAITAFDKTGIEVNTPSPADVVVLRNLYVTGLGGDKGIDFVSGGRLFVESTTVTGFTQYGLLASTAGTTLFVRDSTFRSNTNGGIALDGALQAEISRTRMDASGTGFLAFDHTEVRIVDSEATQNGGAGFSFSGGVSATIAGSTADGNNSGIAVHDDDTSVTVSGAVLSHNSTGLLVSFGSPTARIGGSTVASNGKGLFNNSTGTLETFGDNLVRDNTFGNTDGTITPVSKT